MYRSANDVFLPGNAKPVGQPVTFNIASNSTDLSLSNSNISFLTNYVVDVNKSSTVIDVKNVGNSGSALSGQRDSSALVEVQNVMQSVYIVPESVTAKKFRAILPKNDVLSGVPAPSPQLQNAPEPSVRKKIIAQKTKGAEIKVKLPPGSVNLFGRGMHCDGYNYNSKNKERTR